MKKILALVMVLCMVMVLMPAACADEVIHISLGHDNHPGEPLTMAGEFWAQRLEEVSGGTMVMDLYPSSSAGAKTDLIDQLMAGDPMMVVGDGGFAADYGVPDASIINGPYLFSGWDDVTKLTSSDLWTELKQQMADAGMTVVSDNWWYGCRNTMSVKELKTPEDFKGLIIRVPNSSVYIDSFKALGAAPTAMNLNEVYPALNQGTIEAVENPLSVHLANSIDEVCPYLCMDKHFYQITFIVMSTDFFNSLTEEQQGWLLETGKEAAEYQNDLMLKAEEASIQEMVDRGVQISEVDFAVFAEAAKSFYTDSASAKNWSDGLYERVLEILG